MITPSKTVRLADSALGQATAILQQGPDALDLNTLYSAVADQFDTVDDFLLTLDLLYVLHRVDVDHQTRIITYAR